MRSAESDVDWLRRCGDLTATREDAPFTDPIADGARAAARLLAVARALAQVDSADPHPLGSDHAAVAAVELADTLAAEGPDGPAAELSAHLLPQAYRRALEDAAHAVYHCRLTQHPGARCWFAESGPAADLCGQVLAVTHDLRAEGPLGPADGAATPNTVEPRT